MRGNKSWRAKHARHEPKPDPALLARTRQLQELIEADIRIERMTQAQIWEEIKQRHHGDPPARECYNHLADRRMSTIRSGAGFLARG